MNGVAQGDPSDELSFELNIIQPTCTHPNSGVIEIVNIVTDIDFDDLDFEVRNADGELVGNSIYTDNLPIGGYVVLIYFINKDGDLDFAGKSFYVIRAKCYDLALIKQTISDAPEEYGDTVSFNIEIHNQGEDIAYDISVIDYLPSGLEYLPINNDAIPKWIYKASDRTASTIIPGALAPGEQTEIIIHCRVIPSTDKNAYYNSAEIFNLFDENMRPVGDIDSYPDMNPGNDGIPIDNALLDPDDEDDHDFEIVELYDLALIKTTQLSSGVRPGDVIPFEILVMNQGSKDARNISVLEYMPAGYKLSIIDDNDWTPLDNNTLSNNISYLKAGADTTLLILLEILPGAHIHNLENRSEISYFENEFFERVKDMDSYPDSDPNNEFGIVDDQFNDPNDEDDHDIEILPIFDLALIKTPDRTDVFIGDTIRYDIHLYNQGNVIAENIELIDYLPVGLTPISDVNKGWEVIDKGLEYLVEEPLDPGDYRVIPFYVLINPYAITQETVLNICEIKFATELIVDLKENQSILSNRLMIGRDIDSTPDDNKDNDGVVVDDELFNAGGDEDDSDPAFLRIGICQDLACRNQINISLNEDCTSSITADMMLVDPAYPNADYDIHITDLDGNRIDNLFDATDISKEYLVSVALRNCGDNSCWGKVKIEDKFLPVLNCSDIVISACANVDELAPPSVVENCSIATIEMIGEEIESMSCDQYVSKVTRTWKATDGAGNESLPCTQVIYLERIDVNSITCPADFQVQCGKDYPKDSNGHPHFDLTGVPQNLGVDVVPLDSDAYCNSQVYYSDLELGSTNCSEKFVRVWEVREWWCSGELTASCPQVITIKDTEGPIFDCPTPARFSTTAGTQCSAHVIVPEIQITDACHHDNFTYRITFDGGQLLTNGGDIFLPVGTHEVSIQVIDECGNISSCIWEVEIVDEIQPVAICEQSTVVSISQGPVDVLAIVFDDGSWDECGLSVFEVARLDGYCVAEDIEFGPSVSFCCADALLNPMVALRVTDYAGNTNMCMVSVEVQDKVTPKLSCPEDVEIDCTEAYDLGNLAIRFDEAEVIDNCNNIRPEEEVFTNINSCGIGTITRVFTVTDGDYTTSCSQVINIINQNPFVEGNIVWPEDYDSEDICNVEELDPEDLELLENGERFAYPRYADGVCDLLGYKYDDEVFVLDTNSPGCIKILRTWKVLNWCNEDDNGFDEFTRVQTIKVNNTKAPEIDCPSEEFIECVFNIDCGPGVINLLASANDDCTDELDLFWSWTIDGIIEGEGSDASGLYDLGIHQIEWRVADRCGNESSCTHHFEIRNCKAPTPICIQDLAVELVPMNLDTDPEFDAEMATVWAEDFDAGSYHSCENPIVISFSDTNLDSTSVTFDCEGRGKQRIEMWVTDLLTGAQDYCETYIYVQDNNGVAVCEPLEDGGQMAGINGLISTEDQKFIDMVAVHLEGSEVDDEYTDEGGAYAFKAMPLGEHYDLIPKKDHGYLNGVSTLDLILIQNHITRVSPLDSPYKMIASDINRDGIISSIDLIELRKLILGVHDKFPQNESWRFIPSDFKFLDPSNPFAIPFEEHYSIYPLTNDMEIDFIGVKIGDVNSSVQFQTNGNSIESRSKNPIYLQTNNAYLEPSERALLSFEIKENYQLEGFQMALEYDTDKIEVLELKSKLLALSQKHFSIDHATSGLILISWHNELEKPVITGDQQFLQLEILAKAKTSFEEAISIREDHIQSEIYIDGNIKPILLNFENSTQSEIDHFAAILYPNVPNPWQQKTAIKFYLPIEGEAELRFYNSQGQVLKSMKQNYAMGVHKMTLDRSEFNTEGMLVYELIYRNQVLAKRMILIQ